MIWAMYLFPLAFVAVLAAEFGAYVAKPRISKLAPDYAQRLFRSPSQRLFSRAGPCRFRALYLESPPPGLEKTMMQLRRVPLTSDVLIYAFVGVVAVLFVKSYLD